MEEAILASEAGNGYSNLKDRFRNEQMLLYTSRHPHIHLP
jgi:hypothetical protein